MNINNDLELITERLRLKILDPSYVKVIYDYYLRNKTFFSEYIPSYNEIFSSDELLLKHLWSEYDLIIEGRALRFYLFAENDSISSKIIGDISVSNIIFGGLKCCQIGYKLDNSETGFGYMFEALQRIISFLFDDLSIHRIEAYIMPANENSIKVIERLNFKLEGVAEKYIFINNVWEDHFRYILINPNENN